jgi:hypothetical protein
MAWSSEFLHSNNKSNRSKINSMNKKKTKQPQPQQTTSPFARDLTKAIEAARVEEEFRWKVYMIHATFLPT